MAQYLSFKKSFLVTAILVVVLGVGVNSLTLDAATKDIEAKYPHVLSVEMYQHSWSHFSPGDGIMITEVRGTAKGFKVGESFYVRGMYSLESRTDAQLHVYATNGEVDSSQGLPISKGIGTFEREFTLTKAGMPHVTFYPTKSGSGFGGMYFREIAE